MPVDQDKHNAEIEQAEAAVAEAQRFVDGAEPGTHKDSCLQGLLARKEALESLRQGATAGVGDTHP